jgi:hypothetical protein
MFDTAFFAATPRAVRIDSTIRGEVSSRSAARQKRHARTWHIFATLRENADASEPHAVLYADAFRMRAIHEADAPRVSSCRRG